MAKNYFSRFFANLRNGSILSSIQWRWQKYIQRKRLAWWASQVGIRDYFETNIQKDVRMRLYFDCKLSELIYCNRFESRERQFLNAFLKPGDVFVDIGANIGLFSLIAASCVGDSGKVYAFEPTEKVFSKLRENIRLNHFDNIICFQIALSDRVGEFPFFVCQDGFDAWNSFARPNSGKAFSSELATCDTWDNFAHSNNLVGKVTMMKIDVEGWETHLISGGYETLSRADAPVLQVEFTEEAAQSAGSSCTRLYHILEELGYEMFTYDPDSKKVIHDPLRESYPYLNLIATKRLDKIISRLGRHLI
jgi:FkbM family methyltransferase